MKVMGIDAILGAEWFKPLGKIEWDFARQTMAFHVGDKRVLLTGGLGSEVRAVRGSTLLKSAQQGGEESVLFYLKMSDEGTSMEDNKVDGTNGRNSSRQSLQTQ
ncbi:hypothetical protein L484_026064 [Morus notabilis]|uniref:Uncharacterized protein n=1 Tax=Morus notabilis TaxID=981085 RepID=W9RG34_9ROSA|nr:hypothetical protein L484_026064 [Morus notabilis]